MDLNEDGLLMFFKLYQLEMLKVLWASEEGLSSRDIWEAIDKAKSRASVINSLEEMVENGLLMKNEITGKGGYRGIYKSKYNEKGTRDFIKKLFNSELNKL
ncbi:MAG: hypothetical protein ACTSW1_06130 [Candidatus Hodarchaeales archaeon]